MCIFKLCSHQKWLERNACPTPTSTPALFCFWKQTALPLELETSHCLMISLNETGASFHTHIVCRKQKNNMPTLIYTLVVLSCLWCKGLLLNHFKAFLFFKVACLFPGFMTLDKKNIAAVRVALTLISKLLKAFILFNFALKPEESGIVWFRFDFLPAEKMPL